MKLFPILSWQVPQMGMEFDVMFMLLYCMVLTVFIVLCIVYSPWNSCGK